MENPEQKRYTFLLKYLDWKDFPEAAPNRMKAFLEALNLSEATADHRQQLLSALSDMTKKEHLDLSKHGWQYTLETVEDIWRNTPQAFGRYFLEEYYRNNDSPFGILLREQLHSACLDESELNLGAWLVVGELVIFQLSLELAEAIYASRMEKPDDATGKSATKNIHEHLWFLPGPVVYNPDAILSFPEVEEDFEKLNIFLAVLLEPGSSLTKLITVEYEANFYQFNKESSYEGDIRYAWSDEIIQERDLIPRFLGYIEEAYERIEPKLCSLLIQQFPDIQSLLSTIQEPGKHKANQIFKQEIDPNEPYIGTSLVRWWNQIKEKEERISSLN